MASAKLELESKVCSIDSVQKAAYRLINLITLDVQTSADKIICTLNSNQGISDVSFERAIEEFKKNILDEELRSKIKAETEPVRNLILGLAFSRTGLQQNEQVSKD